ncbi:MAG: hypothetical protein J5875_01350 [Paludibacteraceae bacterium]|nr:hypothetical protein [Paludibacteraceae bacterium]
MRMFLFFATLCCLFSNSLAQKTARSWEGIQFAIVDTKSQKLVPNGYQGSQLLFDVRFNLLKENTSYLGFNGAGWDYEVREKPSFCFDFAKTKEKKALKTWKKIDKAYNGEISERMLPIFDGKNFFGGIWTSDSLFLTAPPFGRKSNAFPFKYHVEENQLTIQIKRSESNFKCAGKDGSDILFENKGLLPNDISGVWIFGDYHIVFMTSEQAEILSSNNRKLPSPYIGPEQHGYMCIFNPYSGQEIFTYWIEKGTLCIYMDAKWDLGMFFRLPFEISADGQIFNVKLDACPTTLSYHN